MIVRIVRFAIAFPATVLIAISSACTLGQPDWIAVATHGMVASDSPHASIIGRDVLKEGGNAIDAATAISFALAVTRPYSTGLGGGGFLIFRDGMTGQVRVFDFRETAPAAATRDMFANTDTSTTTTETSQSASTPTGQASRFGGLAVGVPGLVAGRIEIHRQLGTVPLADLITPAIRLARDGFSVDEHYAHTTRDVLETYRRYPALQSTCGYVFKTHLRSGNLRKPGDVLVQPALARLLDEIARRGADAFYKGVVAHDMVDAIRRHGGIISPTDLTDYRVSERTPIVATYRDYRLLLMPPPSSGGVCITEALNILEPIDLPAIAHHDRSLALHYVIEAMRHAFADRARWLGDADFAQVPVKLLTSKKYATSLPLNATARHPNDGYGISQLPDDAGTSHFCVADRWGNVVVSTETINRSFGSLVAVEKWGLILNNQMDDFTTLPGEENAYGLIQSDRNSIRPGKRPLSSMSPTIVLRNDKPFLILGASGGPRIITSVLNVLLDTTDFAMPLGDAMMALRVHHQWKPPEVFFDRQPDHRIGVALRARGHVLAKTYKTGIVQAIRMTDYQLIGASDPRKGGRPAGY